MNAIFRYEELFLNRAKEYNITALIAKLTVDLEEHYRDKLFSVASKSSDTCYIECFQRKI